jgi:hypothetical protein
MLSFCEDIEEVVWIERTFTDILDQKARRIQICARSKPWWNQTIDDKRRAVSRAKKQHEDGGQEKLRVSRKEMKTERRNVKCGRNS